MLLHHTLTRPPSPIQRPEDSLEETTQSSGRSLLQMVDIVATTGGILLTSIGTLAYGLTNRREKSFSCAFLTGLLIHKLWTIRKYALQQIISKNIKDLSTLDDAMAVRIEEVEGMNHEIAQTVDLLNKAEAEDAAKTKEERAEEKALEQQLEDTRRNLEAQTKTLHQAQELLTKTIEDFEEKIKAHENQQDANKNIIHSLQQEINILKSEMERFIQESKNLSGQIETFNQSIHSFKEEHSHLKETISKISTNEPPPIKPDPTEAIKAMQASIKRLSNIIKTLEQRDQK